tara:strand:- start:142235 stop:143998 length:1764 start_codon:yes stop_codon:yes gene_type:complete
MFKASSIYLFLTLASVFCAINVWSQNDLLIKSKDTINIDFRSGGVGLDSIDASFIGTLNLRPGSGDSRLIEFDLPSALDDQLNGLTYRMNEFRVKPIWSGLPYLGFKYAFGSRLYQAMDVQYHQYFAPQTHLHFRYHRRTSNGFLRNSDFKLNDVNLIFSHSRGRYATEIDAYYAADEQGENNGIVSDSLIPDFPMEFVEVQNNSARSRIRSLDIKWKNYYRLIGDSIVGTGLISRHAFDLVGREFTSPVLDVTAWDTIFIDSSNTRDQYQTSNLSNGAGIFFSSKNVSVDAAVNYRYWRNQNLGSYIDTNEAFLDANAHFQVSESFKLKSYFYFNFLGAIGELKSHTNLVLDLSDKLKIGGRLNFDNLYPDPYLRSNLSNYYQWDLSPNNLELQQRLNVGGYLKFGKKQYLRALVNWTSVNNGRYFIDQEWRQDTLGLISVGSLALDGQLKLGGWSFYPRAVVRFQSANFSYQPVLSARTRITYQTKIFSNNLGIAIGVDGGYDSEYSYLNYDGVLGVSSPVFSGNNVPSLLRLNAFTALSIDQFRFFVRAENIDYFINDPKIRIDEEIPLMPFLIRVGVTWDFFN